MRPAWLALIFVGGSLGTFLRAGLEESIPAVPGQWPWTTFWINLSGALVLGALLESLAARGADTGWRRGVRLGLGTGLLGGYTTYSTFAVETVDLFRSGTWWLGLGYSLAGVVGGFIAAAGGIKVVRLLGGRRPRTQRADQ